MPSPAPTSIARRAVPLVLVAVLLLGGAIAYRLRPPALPPGIATGNGRLEAIEVDVATKVAGRLAEVNAREGDSVPLNAVLARLDAEDLAAQLQAAEAQIRQARESTREAKAGVNSAASQRRLAQSTLKRTEALVQKGYVTGNKLDQDQSTLQTADAALAAAQTRVAEAVAAVESAQAKAEALRVSLRDTALRAPLSGRVLYRLAEPGEVLAAGGKVLTLLDMNDMYLTIYLPTAEAGKVAVGDEARIVLDALETPIPARVSFVAPKAQFTPKEVETRNEREKLMFRLKLRVEPEWLAQHADLAKPGMPGVGYVRTAADVAWPAKLQLR